MKILAAFLIPLLLCLTGPAFGDSDEIDCDRPENAKIKSEAKKNYQDMLASDKAGKHKPAYEAARHLDSHCITKNEQERKRIDTDRIAVLKRSSKKLGEDAESQGKFSVAYDYYANFHGIDADRAQLKLATARPGDFKAVETGVYYFRRMRDALSNEDVGTASPEDLDKARMNVLNRYISQERADAMDPERKTRLQAVNEDLRQLEAIATKNGDATMAEEEKVFAARKTSVMAKSESLGELETARKWYDLAGLGKRADERAVKRGDTLAAEDGRNALGLAISYYEFARNEQKVRSVKDKARRLGDTHLKKGEKVMAADYYNIAGLDDKAREINESHEKESAAAEAKRQEKFKEEQKSLEEELGF